MAAFLPWTRWKEISNHSILLPLASEPDFRLGATLCQPSRLIVSANGVTETLEPRVMQVLVVLAHHKEGVVSRDQLVAQCWNGRVVSDDAIQRCIHRLRKLAETQGGFTLETIRRVGYRLTEGLIAPDTSPLPSAVSASPVPVRSAPRWKVALLLSLLASLVGLWYSEAAREQEQHLTLIAEITDLVGKDQYGRAFALAYPLMQNSATRSAELEALWPRMVLPMRPLVDQEGATLWFKPYEDADGLWIQAGVTPFATSVDAPPGPLRIRIEKPGFRTAHFVISNPGPSVLTDQPYSRPIPDVRPQEIIPLPMITAAALPDDLVPVPYTNITVSLRGWSQTPIGDNRQEIPAFAIERTEVTNRQFKEFIDAGGYENPVFWRDLEFRADGELLTWDLAKARFVDATNRQGPAGWQLSTYPNGQATMPVGGISWYEAVAYARFRGRQLPTIHHWTRAAFTPYDTLYATRPTMALQSRFLAPDPVPANTELGLGPWGTVNMSGNLREWVWNSAGDQTVAMGGSWVDEAFAFFNVSTVPPMQRLPQIGLRLMQTESPVRDELLQPLALWEDTAAISRLPVSDETFAGMRLQFTTNDAKVVEQSIQPLQETELWIAEEVSLRYSDGGTSSLVLVRPRQHAAPLQAIVFGPPGGCCISKRPNREVLEHMSLVEFVASSGRALVLPIWAGSYERYVDPPHETGLMALQDRERQDALLFHQDIDRTIDYLQSRTDIDTGSIGYLGNSHGSVSIAGVVLATEDRIKAAVLLSSAISLRDDIHPMYDSINYAPRITMPVLMLNGRFDAAAPYDPAQRRLFELLGSPAGHKEHLVYDRGHIDLPPNTIAREASNWFDKYLGEVQRNPQQELQ